jgi:pyruvate/2-oxoacid:ferredoxin oxidoreductase alpha subunit
MIEDSQDFIVVENNVVGQLSDLITKHTGIIIPKEKRLLKYDAMPFTPHDIVNSLVRWKK